MNALGLLNAKEAALRRTVYTDPLYNDMIGIVATIVQTQQQNPSETSITLDPAVSMPDAAVNYLQNILKYTVTGTPGAAGFQVVSNISWSNQNLVPYTGIPEYAFVAGANATTTGQVLTTITGLTVALLPNSTYEYEVVLTCTTSAVTTGTGYGINYSAAGAVISGWITGSQSATVQRPMIAMTALNTAVAGFLTTSAQSGGILMKGRITTGANAGNMLVQHLKTTSGTSSVLIGSFLKVIKVL